MGGAVGGKVKAGLVTSVTKAKRDNSKRTAQRVAKMGISVRVRYGRPYSRSWRREV